MSPWILKLSFCSSNAGTKTSAPLIDAIVNNGLLHSNSRIKQIPPQIIHILRFFGILAAQDFLNEMYWGQGCSVASSLEVLRVSYICTFRLEEKMMHKMSAWTPLAEKITISRICKKW